MPADQRFVDRFTHARMGLVEVLGYEALAEDELNLAETEFEVICLAVDVAAGRVPRNARRGLFAHEIDARVNFAGIDDDAQRAARAVAAALAADRERFLALIRGEMIAQGDVDAMVRRLTELAASAGAEEVPGVSALARDTAERLAVLLQEAAAAAASRVAGEAAAQGLGLPGLVRMTSEGEEALARHVARLNQLPKADALRAVVEAVATARPAEGIDAALGLVEDAGRRLSPKPLDNYGRQGASGAIGIGRIEAALSTGVPVSIYASELLDTNTCDPCYTVDGKPYPTIEACREDYPLGMYRFCEGGMMCRGTPVFVWATEDPALA